MKKALVSLLVLAAGIALLGGVRLARLDTAALRDAIAASAQRALGVAVDAERVEIAFLPPALRLRGVHGAAPPGADPDAFPEFRAEEARLGLSLPALAAGRVVLRSLAVTAPRLRIPLGGAGRHAADTAPAPSEPSARAGADDPTFAITHLSIEDGSIEAGPWRLEHLEAAGGLGLDLSISLGVTADAPGLGRLRQGRLELASLASGEPRWKGHAVLEDLDLAELGAQLGSGLELRGRGRVALSAEGSGARVSGGELALELPEACVRAEGFELLGRVSASASRGSPWQVDLSAAELRVGEFLHKPLGAELVISAEPDAELPPRAIHSIRVRSQPLALEAQARLDAPGLRVEVSRARADLAALSPWWLGQWRPLAGAVEVQSASFSAADATFELEGAFQAARFGVSGDAAPVSADDGQGTGPAPADDGQRTGPVPANDGQRTGPVPANDALRAGVGEVALSGPFALRGTRLESSGLELDLARQRAVLSGSMDLATRRFDAQLDAEALDVGRLLSALGGEAALEGRLSARASLSGAASLDSLQGHGSFTLEDGRIPGADFPWPAEVQDPRLTTGEETQAFDALGGRFSVADGVASFQELFFHHPYLSAYLEGDVQLADGALDLTGELELSEELDAGLGGEGRRRVLPVRHVGGRLADPRFEMDREAMAATFQRYAENLREKGAP